MTTRKIRQLGQPWHTDHQPDRLDRHAGRPQDCDNTPYLFGDTIPHFVIGANSTGNGHNVFQDQPLHPEALPDGPSITAGLDVANFTHEFPAPPPSDFTGATYHIGEQAAQAVLPLSRL